MLCSKLQSTHIACIHHALRVTSTQHGVLHTSVHTPLRYVALLNLQNILITLTWLPVTPILCALHSDILLQKLTNGVLITRHTKTQISCTDFFDYVFLTVAYIPLHDDLPTTSIMYGYYFIWQPLVVTLHHMQYNN